MKRVGRASSGRLVLGLLLAVALPASSGLAQGIDGTLASTDRRLPPGVLNEQRAWQHWTLNCQGCHRPDGTGSAATAPSLAGTVARFMSVPGGREYLGRVPGVATSPLSNEDLAEVMNWMLWRFDSTHIPANFAPYTAVEIGSLRTEPLRIEASRVRAELLKKADAAHRQR